MLQKMGWSGQSGLGRLEQGIYNPIEGGEVRERNEMFRGVGMQSSRSDPFEAFRKNKSQGYIQRLRTRDEQRECMIVIFVFSAGSMERSVRLYRVLFNTK